MAKRGICSAGVVLLLLLAAVGRQSLSADQVIQSSEPVVLQAPVSGAITFLKFTSDGRLFAATPLTGLLWPQDAHQDPEQFAFGTDVNPLSKAFSTQFSIVALNARDGATAAIRLMNIQSGRVTMIRHAAPGSEGGVLAVSDDGAQLVSVEMRSGQVIVERFHLPDGGYTKHFVLSPVVSPSGHVAISPLGDRFAIGTHRRTRENPFPPEPVGAVMICTAAGELVTTIPMADIPRGLAFSQDGKRLFAGSAADANVQEFDVETGRELRVLREGMPGRNPGNVGGRGAQGSTLLMTRSEDGVHLATAGSGDSRVRLWDTNRGILVGTLSVDAPIYSIAFEAKGARIAAGTQRGAVYVWRVE